MALQTTESFYYVVDNVITTHPDYGPGPYPRPPRYGLKDPDQYLADHGNHWRLWIDDPGPPGQYENFIVGVPTPNPGASPPRVERIDTRQAWARADFEGYIDDLRRAQDRPPIDVRRDPGLQGLMDEANTAATNKLKELDATDDADLGTFDPTLDPRSGDSVQLSASLASQARSLLAGPAPMTAQQRTDLEAAATGWEAVVTAGDPVAAVDEVPPFARRGVGVFGEEYGHARAYRIQDGGWWWIEIELQIERDLDGATYFLAIYDINAPDDRDDTDTNYMTTAQLMNMGGGRHLADKSAINLPRTDTGLGIKFVLCKDHISEPQFDRVTFEPDDPSERYRFRWGGMV